MSTAARLMPSGLGVRALFDTIRAARAMRPATLPTYAGVPAASWPPWSRV